MRKGALGASAVGLGAALALLPHLVCAANYHELRIYKPAGAPLGTNEYAFWGTAKSDYGLAPYVSSSKGGANKDSGGLAVYSGAWVGASYASASQYIGFDTPVPCHVYATIKLSYTGDTYTYGFASWAGTAWRWSVDNGAWHTRDLDVAFTLETVGGKALDLALLAAGGVEFPETMAAIETLIDVIDHTWTVTQLTQDMNTLLNADQATRIEERIHFTVPAGHHTLAVGLSATTSAMLTGTGLAFIHGQVEEIRLGINSEEGLLPDLIINGVEFDHTHPLRIGTPVVFQVERCNIGNADAALETFELVAVPANGDPAIMIRQRGRSGGVGYRSLPAYTSIEERVRYSFDKKGTYRLIAEVDPDGLVPELNELNNQYWRTIRVLGQPPTTPQKPNFGHPLDLHRNQTFQLTTTATDREDDRLFYRFEIKPVGATEWQVLTNAVNVSSNGWRAVSHLVITPVLEDPDLLPPASLGINPNTYVAFATNRYHIRVRAADEDGFSGYSAEKALTVVLNTLPGKPIVTGDAFGDTMQGVSITASSSDAEGDPIAFRFDWGESPTPVWTDWIWCDPGQTRLTVSHRYPHGANYCVAVQATDRYAARYTSPVKTSAAASHCLWISPYIAPTNSLIVTTFDQDRNARLPNVGFAITGATNWSDHTWANGFWHTSALPGTYTVTFSNLTGYVTPSAQTRTLPYRGSVQFDGGYTHATGAIQVFCNIAGQGRITGAGTARGNDYHFSGQSWSVADAWAGEHAIVFEPVDAMTYGLPVTVAETNTLAAGKSLAFYGRYIKRPRAALTFAYPTNRYQPAHAFVLVNEEFVEFDASASSSPAQPTGGGVFPPLTPSIDRYRFEFDDTPDYEEDVHAGAPDGLFDGKTRHAFRQTGRRKVTVIVYDSLGCASLAANTVEVRVKERPVARLTIDPSPGIAGETITFAGSGTDGDAGDTVTGYEWTLDEAGVISTQPVFTLNTLAVGVHAVTLRVRANDRVWSKPATASLEVCLPKDWPAFKKDRRRLSHQPSYAGRVYGQLPYGPAPGFWPVCAAGPIEGSPVVANLDGHWTNGLEVAFVSRDGVLRVVDSRGGSLWSANVGVSSSTPAIGDLSGDGSPDIVVGSQTGVYAFSAQGAPRYSYTNAGGFAYAMPLIADVDPQTPGREVVVTADDGSVHVLDRQGAPGAGAWPFVYPAPALGPPPFPSAPAVTELDPQQAGREIVVGGRDGNLYVLSSGGTALASFLVPGGAPIFTTPAIADLCPRAKGPEIVFGADNGVVYCLNYQGGRLTPVWQYAITPPVPIRSSPAIGMVGESGFSHLVFGADDGVVRVLMSTNGTLVGSFNCGAGVRVRSTPVIANIDTWRNPNPLLGDLPEVIVAADNGALYALSFANGVTNLWTQKLSAMPIYSSPAVADLDHDPDLEILVGANDNCLYALKATPNPALAPVVDFAATPITGGRPLSVTFTNLTRNGASVLAFWHWDFGDGAASTERNPTHVYQTPGAYTVTLTARNPHGARRVAKTNYLAVSAVPAADFSGGPRWGTVPLTVNFTNRSLYGATTWAWEFGDQGRGTEENPTHVYTIPGTYSVTLTVANAHGTNQCTRPSWITAQAAPPRADFTADATFGCAPLTVHFTDQSEHNPSSWAWDFGDGSVSHQRNPAHAFPAAGRYLVSLTVANAGGSDTRVSDTYLTVVSDPAPTVDPVLELAFDEGAGAVAHDATPNHHDGAITGATWTEGYAGMALYFHGGGQFANGDGVWCADTAALRFSEPFRVEARLKAVGSDHYLCLVDKYQHLSGDAAAGFTFYLTGGRLRFTLYQGGAHHGVMGTTDLRDATWHHGVAVWDGTRLQVFADGQLEGEASCDQPPAATTAPLCVGKRSSGWGGYMPFHGSLDEVAIAQLLPAPPPVLNARLKAGEVVISWTGCARLEWAPDLVGPWREVAPCVRPYVVRPGGQRAFYRLRVARP